MLINENGNKDIPKNNYTSPDDNGFCEYYNIQQGNSLIVSRLLDLIKDGVYYELTDVKSSVSTDYATSLQNLKNAASDDTAKNKGRMTVTAGDTSKCILITFKYKKKDIPDDDPGPKGGIDTLNSNDEINDCQMSYTPTNADIKPYLVARRFKIKDLKYEYAVNSDEIDYYNMKVFNIDRLISGTIADNDKGTNDLDKTWKIFGSEKYTLLDGSSPQNFDINDRGNKISNKVLGEVYNFKDSYSSSLPSPSALDEFIKNSIKKDVNKTSDSDFSKTFHIPSDKYNGLRIPKLIANYKGYDVISDTYNGDETSDGTSNTAKVLVYNPIKVEEPDVKSEGIVDHSPDKKGNTDIIQKNANFELTLKLSDSEVYTGHKYSEYLDRYYLIFDIDIVKTNKTSYTALYTVSKDNLNKITKNVGEVIERGTLIELPKDTEKFNAKASNNKEEGDVISQNKSSITLIGVSNNMPGDVLKNVVLKAEYQSAITKISIDNYISTGTNSEYKINGKNSGSVMKDYCDGNIKYTNFQVHKTDHYNGIDMYGDAYYFAKAVKKVTNIGRIYDFKVTDCSDIDYKSVFRKGSGNTVNDLTGNVYFSGIKELKIYSSGVNDLEERNDISISNSTSKKIFPLGPYKNTNTSYVGAPKMGYRISFDLKTSGVFIANTDNSTREIHITPSYYYISKDGETFEKNINLYYKNSSGKYVNFVGSDYTIYFKPKDGYRSLYNQTSTPDTKSMSSQLEPLNIGSKTGFTLNTNMMSRANNNFIQAWYGEFKLPNSTIAVKGENVSKPLTDGYIGVIFNIECIDNKGKTNEKIISYNTDNKNANPSINTTQWDYEGFLGFDSPGKSVDDVGDIILQLEKENWKINNTIYQDIKGTVVLFDTDNRASNDFD